MVPVRIPPDEVRKKVLAGEALLVCSYEDDERFERTRIEGAISYNEFESLKGDLSKGREIVFYCA